MKPYTASNITIRRLLMVVAVSVAALASQARAFGQLSGADPMMGTWRINLGKSIYDPGPKPTRDFIVTFEPAGPNGIKTIIEGTDAQGRPSRSEYVANFDGKDYPETGESYDTVSLRRLDAYTVVAVNKKGGQVVRMLRRVFSKDGKTFTVSAVGINPQGQAFHIICVYDRQ